MATRSVPQPPFSAELLADLHADNLEPDLRDQLWPLVRKDPEAQSFLRGLDDVGAELRALGRNEHVLHTMPDDVSARLAQFIEGLEPVSGHDSPGRAPTETEPDDTAARLAPFTADPDGDSGGPDATVHRFVARPETNGAPKPSAPPAPTAEPTSLAERRRGRLRWLTAAAAAVAVVACASIAVTAVRGNDAPPIAQPPTGTVRIPDELIMVAATKALGRNDASGALSTDAARMRCVQANGLDKRILGSTDFRFDGQEAVLILLTAPRPKTTVLVVGTGCTTGDPQQFYLRDIG